MKINLPNPDDFVNDIPGFFDQLELCVYHARKAAEKILTKYSQEDIEAGNDTPWVKFRLPDFDTGSEFGKKLEELDPNRSIENDISISIEEM